MRDSAAAVKSEDDGQHRESRARAWPRRRQPLRHLQILLRRGGAEGRQRRVLCRRSSRHSRRERRRQVDPDEHHFRHAAAGRGRRSTFEGQRIASMTPELASSLGIADLLPASGRPRRSVGARKPPGRAAGIGVRGQVDAAPSRGEMLDAVGLHVPLRARSDTLPVAQKHLLEIAKALALKPKVLILDEPTAALDQEATDMLFGRIREVVKTGYVGHLHHAPPRRDPPDCAARHRAPRRQVSRQLAGARDQRSRPPQPDRRPDARLDVSAEVARREPADINLAVKSISGKKFRNVSFRRRPRRDHRRRRRRRQRPGGTDARRSPACSRPRATSSSTGAR